MTSKLQGLYFPHEMIRKPERSGIFLLDLNAEEPEPVQLPLEGFKYNINPHGMSKWIGKDGSWYLYVINHRSDGDAVESFEYKPSAKKLIHRKTIQDPNLYNLNSLIAVDLDKFYATVDHYFKHSVLREIEIYSRMAMAHVAYYNGKKAIKASDSIAFPNGISRSLDGRYR